MKRLWLTFASCCVLFSACGGQPPLEKVILGTWVQETPTSTTTSGLQTLTSDTVLRLKKNGETHLTRNLDVTGQGLPVSGIRVSVELKGSWELQNGQLTQTPSSVMIMPRSTDKRSVEWADTLQSQAEKSPASVKTVVAADKSQLILQDVELGTTDVYRRK